MARVHRIPDFFHFFIYFSIFSCCLLNLASANRELDESNWRDILEGEWMVEFYAPWCPACSALAPTWRELSARAGKQSLAMRAASVDVTKSPGLSGRFVVTALPTIFHVIDGEFRQYKGPRDVDSMLSFVQQKRWQQTEPVPSWKGPDSLQMGLVAQFFKLSQALRSVHNMLMETYGLPTWGSYLIFAVATIFIGALLGLVLVCLIDVLYPPRRKDFVPAAHAGARGDAGNKSDDEQEELINEDIVDDAPSGADSDAEKNSPSDSSEEESVGAAAGGDARAPEVRKRRPRKAD
ncbi:thioredoxin-related transmembrane protein 1-like isoform X1 [Leguminivora glycinivorella]|uniref:thioredoxin-related transmembrane protein 1-like isoform X1 n=1 Tax=Leguminivora glycinivorella TaxID=1035111 RepID=UPI00200E1CC1|nr:thioredoxin-related transmembrane protein 1-like isoform X1 [Leguminivora glycinivorella]